MSSAILSVEEVAAILKLKAKTVGGKVRYIGANPTGDGAKKDGFTLFSEGHAMDNNGARYTSPEVAKMAQVDPNKYAPVVSYSEAGKGGTSSKSKIIKSNFAWDKATVFDYTDEAGALLFQVGRIGSGESKEIRQRRPDGLGGYVTALGDARRVLYRLPEILAARSVMVVEGEKAVEAARDALAEVGLLGEYAVTTNPGGAGKWKAEFCQPLAGKRVFFLPDNDKAGIQHASGSKIFFDSMDFDARPTLLCKVDLPNLPEKGDISDFLALGGHIGEVLELCDASPPWDALNGLETPPMARFEVFSFADLERMPSPRWLVRGLLVEETTSVLSADSGSFKSFFALDMALSVATGRDFHGREVKAGSVVYVAAEGFFTLRDRAKAWSQFHGVALPQNFHMLRVPMNVSDPATVGAFTSQFAAFDPALIVLDTLSQNAPGLSENSNDEMARFMAGMMATARTLKAHVQAVHHHSKAGSLRGASAIHNNADAHISLERPEGDTANIVFVRCEKQRGAPFVPFALKGQQIELPYLDEYGDPVTSLAFEIAGDAPMPSGDGRAGRKAASTGRLLALLNDLRGALGDGENVSKDQWRDAAISLGVASKANFYRLAKDLEEQGAWHWWKGDCRTDTPEINLEAAKQRQSQ